MRNLDRFTSNCEAVVQYALLRVSKLSPSRVALQKKPRVLRCEMRHLVRFTSNYEAVVTICPPKGVETKPFQGCASKKTSGFIATNSFAYHTICLPKGVETKPLSDPRREKLLGFYVAKSLTASHTTQYAFLTASHTQQLRIPHNMPS